MNTQKALDAVEKAIDIAFEAGVKSHQKTERLLTIGFAEWLDIEGIRQGEHYWKCKKDNYNKKYLTSEMLEMYYETLK